MDDIDKRMQAMEILLSMSEDDRVEVMQRFCGGCGVKNDDVDRTRCQCENDE